MGLLSGRATRRLLVAALGLCLWVAGAPSAALAATRCVDFDGPGCDSSHTAIGNDSAAGTAVQEADPGDTIRIAPGTHEESVWTDKNLSFVGAGSGTLDSFDEATQTRIAGGSSGSQGEPALQLRGGGAVASIRLAGGSGSSSSGSGLELISFGPFDPLAYSVSQVFAFAGSGGMGGASGLLVYDSGAGGRIDLTVAGGGFAGTGPSAGVRLLAPAGLKSLSEVTLRGGHSGAELNGGELRLIRSVARAAVGVQVLADTIEAKAEVIDSVLVGAQAAAFVNVVNTANASLSVRGSTLLGTGSNVYGVRTLKPSFASGSASADLRNTIARAPTGDPNSADLLAYGGRITADYSSFTTSRTETDGTAPAPGSASNVSGDPLFTNEAAEDLTLQSGSLLIDRGDPAIVMPGQLDLAGSPRSLDGNGDCLARPDIGAFERPDSCLPLQIANTAPTVSGFGATNRVFAPRGRLSSAAQRRPRRRLKRGTTFRYTLSEAARLTITIERILTGRRVRSRGRIRCVRPTRRNRRARRCNRYRRSGAIRQQKQAGRRSTPFSGRFRGRPLRPGRYRARLVAADPQGARSRERRLTFRVVWR